MASPTEEISFPASANQKRMFVLDRLSPGGVEYNVPVALRLQGRVDAARLADSLSALVERHATLRSSFDLDGGEVVQKILRRVDLPLPVREAGCRAEIEEINRGFVRPFDLRAAPLLRACLVRLEKDEHVLLLDMHHIVCDGLSVDILLDELGRLYDGQELARPPREYRDFVEWQRAFAGSAQAVKQEEYWLGLLGEGRPVLNLPTDFPRKAAQSPAGDRVFLRPDRELTAALRSLAARNRVSLYMLLLSAYYVLLSKYSGQEDMVVGTLVAGRPAEEFQGVVGLFVNTLLLRSRPRGELTFVDYLKEVRGECLGAFEHQEYQFEELVDRIAPPRDLGRNPLFDTMFGALSSAESVTRCGGVDFSRCELDYRISKFDLSLTQIERQDQELVLEFEYRSELFRRETVERLAAHYLHLLQAVLRDPRVRLSEIDMLTAGERERLAAPPARGAQQGGGGTVLDLFLAQAARNPSAPALSFGSETLSYGELDLRSGQLAARLRGHGVGRGDLVGVAARPSFEMIIALLGVLKLGAAYLPVDPATPPERFRGIAGDSRLAALLIPGEPGHFACAGVPTIQLDEETASNAEPLPAPPCLSPEELAYVIYTSGSTGTPKGVMVSHGALANYIAWATRTYVGEETLSFALHSPLAVDLTVTSIFVPLVSGNRIVIYRGDDPLALIGEMVRDNQVELLKLTPTHLSLLAEAAAGAGAQASRLKRLIVGGEDLKSALAATIHQSFGGRIEIYNEYGPTEATVGCTIHRYDPRTDTALSVPVGRAIDNSAVYLLDRYGKPVPEGAAGELCVAGVCLAQGYLNNPRLTAERFVVNRIGEADIRMYRTGDLARLLPGGVIDYLGRNDDQVKIRGFRVELGEIEAALVRLAQVKQAVVVTRVDPAGDLCLCAYLVAEGEVAAAELRARLADYLPSHMIPAWFVPLDHLPVARGGKLDKGALPDPRRFTAGSPACAAPATGAEAALAAIWQDVLGVDKVGIDDNFFDLGGQSLKAIFMTARVNRGLGASLSLRDVFAHPTIRELAALAAQAGERKPSAIEPVGEREHYPVSSAQKRLFILNQLAPGDVQYNVPWAMEIAGPFDAGRWEEAFRALIARHESLRTSFALVGDEIVQKVQRSARFAFEELKPDGAPVIDREIERFVRPFDLGQAPLLRGAVLKTGASSHALLVDMHHIVSDGISVEVILDELRSLYLGETLAAPAVQYKEYAAWQRARLNSAEVRAQEAYWMRLFEGELPVLNLPTDHPRRAVQSFEGGMVTFRAGAPILEGLRAIGRECGATMHMTLLAAYTILLSKYAGQEDLVVGTPVAGRNHASLERVVGMFVNTLALRNRPLGELSFGRYLCAVRDNALEAYGNEEYQFEELVEKLAIARNLSRNPLFDTVFAYLGDARKSFEIEGVSVKLLDFEWKISKFDLTVLASEREGGLDFELEYCSRLFRKETIERLALHYHNVLEQIVRHPGLKIAEIDPLSEGERRQILVEFNRTVHDYPAGRSIHAIFEEQVEKTPGNAAVVFGKEALSYRELNRRANQLARLLAGKGAAREEVVGIMAGASVEMVVGILGILKAGCAYLPIDRDCPRERAAAMLGDSGAKIVLLAGGAAWHDDERLVLDLADPVLFQGEGSNPANGVTGRDLAYVIYTSGTSGAPKGVMIEHHSVNNLCAWHVDTFGVTAADRATKYARFSFDASVWEIFPYLQAGAALHVIGDEMRLDLPRLNRYFEEQGITVSFLPTQICELFLELENNSLRTLLTGGDRLRRFRPKGYRVVNNYGPTEATVVATSCTVRGEAESIPIGRPLHNTRVYILGKGNQVVPVGVAGELCVAGAGLARGYLNDPGRTAERFVADPFASGERMYRTGDLARWLPDGSIEFIGRTDDQVKIRGCRTEPREIEATILAHEAVRDAVVVAREGSDNSKFLCAYVVWQGAPREAELKSWLSGQLPDYMAPAFLLGVDHIPLNPRGKVDLESLPSPDAGGTGGQDDVEPRNDTERRLAGIWRAVLDRREVGVHDRFFEIGGDSLRATIMLAKANREFDSNVALGAVFDKPSIALLAPCFENVVKDETMVLKAAQRRLQYAVTPTQALMHAVCSARNGVEYNLPMSYEFRGELDVARLENAFRQLIRRHEAFRTSFTLVGGKPMLTVAPEVDFSIRVLEECGEDEIEAVARDFIRPFDLARPPLLRVALIPMGPGRHVVMMDVHHLVSDGTSHGILFEEMAALYAGKEPPLPAVTFKDFAEWLGGHLETKQVAGMEKYWQEVLDNPPPMLRLDGDYPRPESFTFAGSRIKFEAEPWVHGALKSFCAEHEVTLFMALLAAYSVLLSKYSGQEDMIVAFPTVGRYLAEVQDVLGMFVSTHLVRTRPQAGLRFDEFVEQVKGGVRGALEHQEYQLWGMMLGHTLRSGGKDQLFSTVFVVQQRSFTAMEIPGLTVREIDVGYPVAKFDITLGAVEKEGGIEFELEYGTDIFARSTVRRFAGHFLNVLGQLLSEPRRELRQIEVMTAFEKERVLREFNGRLLERAGAGNVVVAFERQARLFPDRVALLFGGAGMTYGELNRRANQLARRLRGHGLRAGGIAGVMAPPSLVMVVGMLAVLKTGGAYLPIGTSFPRERIAHLLDDSGAQLLLCGSAADYSHCKTAVVELENGNNYDADGSNLEPLRDPGALAYVSYAADQNGDLRGVLIEHRSLADRCQWFAERFAVTPDDRSVKYGDLTASATIFEIFPFLCAGASISLFPGLCGRDADALAGSLEESGATIAWLPAPLCGRLASADNSRLRLLITSGQQVSAARLGAYDLVKCYGAAENTEVTACSTVTGDSAGTVGKPITNAGIYIVGHDGGLQPVGVTGELCVGGAGLARGYLGSEPAHPFTVNPHADGGRMYRTGEFARWLADGRVELTRRAGEASIDGHRVRLAEIERRLSAHPAVREAAVVFDDKEPLDERLVAFLVLESTPPEPRQFVQELKLHLQGWLPGYMVPDAYIKIGMMPRDGAGRVQYERLPLPDRKEQKGGVQPATAHRVSSMVEELLGRGNIGADANLFDHGMTSLLAATLALRLKGEFGAAPELCQLLTTPTIAGISQALSGAHYGGSEHLGPAGG